MPSFIYRIHDVYESGRLQSGPPQTTVSGQKIWVPRLPRPSLSPLSLSRTASAPSLLLSPVSGVRTVLCREGRRALEPFWVRCHSSSCSASDCRPRHQLHVWLQLSCMATGTNFEPLYIRVTPKSGTFIQILVCDSLFEQLFCDINLLC